MNNYRLWLSFLFNNELKVKIRKRMRFNYETYNVSSSNSYMPFFIDLLNLISIPFKFNLIYSNNYELEKEEYIPFTIHSSSFLFFYFIFFNLIHRLRGIAYTLSCQSTNSSIRFLCNQHYFDNHFEIIDKDQWIWTNLVVLHTFFDNMVWWVLALNIVNICHVTVVLLEKRDKFNKKHKGQELRKIKLVWPFCQTISVI